MAPSAALVWLGGWAIACCRGPGPCTGMMAGCSHLHAMPAACAYAQEVAARALRSAELHGRCSKHAQASWLRDVPRQQAEEACCPLAPPRRPPPPTVASLLFFSIDGVAAFITTGFATQVTKVSSRFEVVF